MRQWNFCYVLPKKGGQLTQLVVPTALQMGWIESPPCFSAASETARDVEEAYVQARMGSLPTHKFEKHVAQGIDFSRLPARTVAQAMLRFLIEVYVDDFVAVTVARS